MGQVPEPAIARMTGFVVYRLYRRNSEGRSWTILHPLMCGPRRLSRTKRRKAWYESLQTTVERLLNHPAVDFASVREGLQRSLKFYVALFLLGFMFAFPLSSEFIGWSMKVVCLSVWKSS